MLKTLPLAALSVALGLTMSMAPAAEAAKKPRFAPAPASLEIDTSGKFVIGCTNLKARKDCRRLYTAAKTRAGKTMFNKVRSANAKLKVQGRYWEQCNMSGCFTVYSGTGGLYGGDYNSY